MAQWFNLARRRWSEIVCGQGRGRTADLPLFRRNRAVVDCRWPSPDKPVTCTDRRWGSPASMTACLRWLPIWLPAVGDPAVIGLHISGFADRSLNSRPSQQLSPVPNHRGLQRGLYHVQQRHLQLTHNLPSCRAHAAVPLMINRQEGRGCTCRTRSGQTVGTGTRQDWSSCPSQNARHRRGRRAKYPPLCATARLLKWPLDVMPNCVICIRLPAVGRRPGDRHAKCPACGGSGAPVGWCCWAGWTAIRG